jgi:hypothetical protein
VSCPLCGGNFIGLSSVDWSKCRSCGFAKRYSDTLPSDMDGWNDEALVAWVQAHRASVSFISTNGVDPFRSACRDYLLHRETR